MNFSAVDTIWVLFGAALVFFMQPGFAMVEAGFTRAKNAGNIIMKNFIDFAIGTLAFWAVGFGIMFGGSGALIGGFDPFILNFNANASFPTPAFIIFQTVFCATAATIVSGAMAERTKFSAYCVYSLVISLLIYPVSGHWIWGGGWLSQMGFHDFAGSTAVHLVGGVAALIGAWMLGPRTGKYDKDGNPKAIPGHNITLGALGVLILWFGWFGFNGGSTVSMTGGAIVTASNVFVNTNLAAVTATLATMFITWVRYKKPDVSMTLNGSLAGLVAVTAGADVVDPFGAFAIGLIASFALVFGIEFIEKKLKVDDPVGAIGVHCVNGALGTLLVGLFSTQEGLFYGYGAGSLGLQALGVGTVAGYTAITVGITFYVIKKTIGLRVSEHEERVGLDFEEHGLASAYGDFMMTTDSDAAPIDVAIPVLDFARPETTEADPHKMTKVSIITRQSQFEALRAAMETLGITGMTVTNVMGFGIQRGHVDYYRGAPVDSSLLPKIQIDMVISKIPVQSMIDAVRATLYTGKVGDGKIFIYDVENVVRVRTGEYGYDALQDE